MGQRQPRTSATPRAVSRGPGKGHPGEYSTSAGTHREHFPSKPSARPERFPQSSNWSIVGRKTGAWHSPASPPPEPLAHPLALSRLPEAAALSRPDAHQPHAITASLIGGARGDTRGSRGVVRPVKGGARRSPGAQRPGPGWEAPAPSHKPGRALGARWVHPHRWAHAQRWARLSSRWRRARVERVAVCCGFRARERCY